jgi:hypothetical protein
LRHKPISSNKHFQQITSHHFKCIAPLLGLLKIKKPPQDSEADVDPSRHPFAISDL